MLAPEAERTGQGRPQWFRPVLVVIVLGGAAARLAFVSRVTIPPLYYNDSNFFRTTGQNLANGLGYVDTGSPYPHQLVPTASHPPLFPGLLSVFDLLGLQSITAQRLALAVVTSIAILVMGLLGRRVAGPLVGTVAAAIAAFNPVWIQPVGALMSESIYLVVIPLLLLQALRCLEKPTIGRYAVMGIVIGCAVLIRSDAIVFAVFLGVPLLFLIRSSWQNRGLLGVALLAGLILVLAPWLIRNEIQIGGAVLSDQEGHTLASSYCPYTFNSADPSYGSFKGICVISDGAFHLLEKPPAAARQWTELTLDRALTHDSEQFALHHLSSLPRVIVAREAATWGLGNRSYQLGVAVAEGRNEAYEQASWIVYWLMVPFVVIGCVVLARRSWRPLIVLVAPLAVVAVNAAIFYGSTRLRSAAEPSLAVLAATGGIAATNRMMLVLRGPSPGLSHDKTQRPDQENAPHPSAIEGFDGGPTRLLETVGEDLPDP
jgi:4-amino-4-deoxy-L-arabinose transferase-like glycosyltransferase